MSAGRFKSKDDYFTHKSGLAERVISAKPQKVRRRSIESTVPATLLRVLFCKTVDEFEIEGKGRFKKGEYPLDDAIASHLEGDLTVLVNPLSHSGETAFSVVRFDLSESMDHPFSCARQFADELGAFSIPCLIEVNEGGKGHYHLWVFHEEPIPAWQFSEALIRLGGSLFNTMIDTVPSVRGVEFVPLPLQGESLLLQRRVFVNAVGKMIRDQGNVLRSLEYCPRRTSSAFIEHMNRMAAKPVPAQTARPVREENPAPASAPTPAPPARPGVKQQQPPAAAHTAPTSDLAPPAAPIAPVPSPRPPETPRVSTERPEQERPQISPRTESIQPERERIVERLSATAPPLALPPEPAPVEEPAVPAAAADSPQSSAPVQVETVQERVPEAVPAVERPVESERTMPSEISCDRLLLFERGGTEWGIPHDQVLRVAALEKGSTGFTVSGGIVRSGSETLVLVDTAASDPGAGIQAYVPRFEVILAGAFKGFALAADRISGVRALMKGSKKVSGQERIVFESADGSHRIDVPDLEALCKTAEKTDGLPVSSTSSRSYRGMFLILSMRNALYAIPSEKVRNVLPADARDTGVMIDPARACGLEPSMGEKWTMEPEHCRRIVVEGREGLVTVAAERVIGMKKIDSDSMEDVSVFKEKIQSSYADARRTYSPRIFILDPEFVGW